MFILMTVVHLSLWLTDDYKRGDSLSNEAKQVMGHSDMKVSLTYLRGLEVAELKQEDMPGLSS